MTICVVDVLGGDWNIANDLQLEFCFVHNTQQSQTSASNEAREKHRDQATKNILNMCMLHATVWCVHT